MLLSYSDLQGNRHDDADNYDDGDDGDDDDNDIEMSSTVVVELGREPFELHLFQKSFIQVGQIQCCYNHGDSSDDEGD